MRNFLMIMVMVLATTVFGIAQTQTLDSFAQAIAKAEGFGQKGVIPTRYHNPGDIKAIHGYRFYGQVGVGKGGHIVFRNDAAGWYALREQVSKMACGESRVYSPQMSLYQIGRRYAGNYKVWSKNVAKNLGVRPSTTLAELFDIPPAFQESWR